MRVLPAPHHVIGRSMATFGLVAVLALTGCGTDDAPTADPPPETGPTTTARSMQTTSPSDSADGAATSPQDADPLDGLVIRIDQEIRFAAGGTSATVSGAAIRGERDVYRLGAASGQQLIVELTSVDSNGVVDVFAPDGTVLVAGQATAAVTLPLDGEYLVVVGGTRGNVTYDLTVTIPA